MLKDTNQCKEEDIILKLSLARGMIRFQTFARSKKQQYLFDIPAVYRFYLASYMVF